MARSWTIDFNSVKPLDHFNTLLDLLYWSNCQIRECLRPQSRLRVPRHSRCIPNSRNPSRSGKTPLTDRGQLATWRAESTFTARASGSDRVFDLSGDCWLRSFLVLRDFPVSQPSRDPRLDEKWPSDASSSLIFRRLLRSPVVGLARLRRLHSATTSGRSSLWLLRPSHLPPSWRLRSRACRSLWTRRAFSYSAKAPAIWRIKSPFSPRLKRSRIRLSKR